MIPTDDPTLSAQWLTAARDPSIAAALESIYDQVSVAITGRGPACWASGRCCNFEKAGHRLYVTGLEAAYTVSRLTDLTLDAPAITDARARGGCPLQVLNLCGAHTFKPLGCRVYFCDRSAQLWQHELSERALEQIKTLHNQHAIAYRYGEWRDMLGLFAD